MTFTPPVRVEPDGARAAGTPETCIADAPEQPNHPSRPTHAGLGQVRAGAPTVRLELCGTDRLVRHVSFLLGRMSGPDSPVFGLLAQYPNVSREHARVTVRGDHFLVEDRGSTNGTFTSSGERVSGPTMVSNPGRIRLAANCWVAVSIVTGTGDLSDVASGDLTGDAIADPEPTDGPVAEPAS